MVGSSAGGTSLPPATAAYHPGNLPAPLRHLRPGCILQHGDGLHGTVLGLPTALQSGRSLYCPAAADKRLVCNSHVVTRAYLLWPALQAIPDWLKNAWVPVRGAEVKVRWSGFTLKQRAWLNITNQRKTYEEQPLLLYAIASNNGVLPECSLVQTPGYATGPAALQDAPGQLFFPPALVFCSAKSHANKHNPAATIAASAAGATAADGSRDSVPGGLHFLEVPMDDLAYSPLEDVCYVLEEGMFDASSLSQAAADALLHRSMAAGDDELLLMLVQADACLRCSHGALQLILDYAYQRDLIPLAEHVLRCTTVELTQPELTWMVRNLVASGNMFEAERLLAGYVLARRNALSSTAAIEYALMKAATSSVVPSQEAMQLAMRFRAAKHTLMRQLMKRYSDNQRGSISGGGGYNTHGSDSIQRSLSYAPGSSSGPNSGRFVKQSNMPLMLLDPLLHTVKLCLQEPSIHVIGRGTGEGRLSIHDSSPYSLAMPLQDSVFLGMQPVQDYTRLIWRGLELHKMRRVTWQAMASAEAAAADGPFNSTMHSMQRMMGIAGDSRQLSVVSPCTLLLHAGSVDMADIRSYRMSRATAELTPVRELEGEAAPGPGANSNSRWGPGPCAEGAEGMMWQYNTAFDNQGQQGAAAANNSSLKPIAPGGSATLNNAHRRRTNQGNRTVASNSKGTTRRTGAAADSHGSGAAAAADSSWMDTHVGFDLMQNLGLAGGMGASLALLGAILLHGVLLSPRALHDSSWGRWVKRMVFEVFFLVIFQMTVMGEYPRLLMFALPAILLGNVLDIVYQLKFKWDGNLWTYLQDHWCKLDALVNFGMLALVIWEYLVKFAGMQPMDVYNLGQYGIQMESIVQSAFAVLVWARALLLLTPLSSKLGAMLYILRRAAEEVAVLVPVVLVIMLGFGTSLTVAYHTTEPKFGTLLGSMRMLVTISPTDMRPALFEDAVGDNPFLSAWGQIIMVMYICLVSILIMSLLVAVITHAYNPESVQAHAIVMQAETTFHYDFHVRHALPCSPVNLVQLLFAWLPRGFRSRVLPQACLKRWLIPLDGYVPDAIASSPAMLLVTGPSEIGYLAFMFLMYPLFASIGFVLLAAHMPFSVLYFALWGHQVWLESPWSGDSSTQGEALSTTNKATLAAAAAAAGDPIVGSPRPRGSIDTPAGARQRGSKSIELQVPWAARSRASIGEVPAGGPALQPSASALGRGGRQQRGSMSSDLFGKQATGSPAWNGVKPLSIPGESANTGPASPAPQQRQSVFSSQPSGYSAGAWRRGSWGVRRFLLRCAATVAAAIVGTIAYFALLVALLLALLWAWFTRTVFSLYCIFSPSAADTNCCLKHTRAGDFWGRADVHSAFAAAKLPVLPAQQLSQISRQMSESADKHDSDDASCHIAVASGVGTVQSTGAGPAAAAAAAVPGEPRMASSIRFTNDNHPEVGRTDNLSRLGPGRTAGGWDVSSFNGASSSSGAAAPAAPAGQIAGGPAVANREGFAGRSVMPDGAGVGREGPEQQHHMISEVHPPGWASMSGEHQ